MQDAYFAYGQFKIYGGETLTREFCTCLEFYLFEIYGFIFRHELSYAFCRSEDHKIPFLWICKTDSLVLEYGNCQYQNEKNKLKQLIKDLDVDWLI